MTVVAVVGATGYLGRSVCSHAAEMGWTTIVCGRSGVPTAWADLHDDFDAVVNCAGVGMDSSDVRAGVELLDANVVVPVAAAALALRTGARMVHLGSAAQSVERLVGESPYVRSKHLASAALRLLADTDGLRGVELMPHIVYGGVESTGVVGAMLRTIASGRAFALRTPAVRRDFVHVDDVSRAVIAAVESDDPSWYSVEVGTGVGHPLSEVAELIGDLTGVDDPWRFEPGPGRPWVDDLVADPAPAHDRLGFTALITLGDGLASSLPPLKKESNA